MYKMENECVSVQTRTAFDKLSGRGGGEIDEEGAVELLEEQVKKGDCEAMWILGLCCEFGMGTEQDLERAVLLYQQSSEGGNSGGLFMKKNGRNRGSYKMRLYGVQRMDEDSSFNMTLFKDIDG